MYTAAVRCAEWPAFYILQGYQAMVMDMDVRRPDIHTSSNQSCCKAAIRPAGAWFCNGVISACWTPQCNLKMWPGGHRPMSPFRGKNVVCRSRHYGILGYVTVFLGCIWGSFTRSALLQKWKSVLIWYLLSPTICLHGFIINSTRILI